MALAEVLNRKLTIKSEDLEPDSPLKVKKIKVKLGYVEKRLYLAKKAAMKRIKEKSAAYARDMEEFRPPSRHVTGLSVKLEMPEIVPKIKEIKKKKL